MAVKQFGTSGGGNHFVEFGVVDMPELGETRLAVLSHSGSRGMGNKIGLMYSDLAIQKCKLQNDAKRLAWLNLDDPDGIEYWEAMNLAGEFAEACHYVIHERIRRALGSKVLRTIQNHHNFAWKEVVDGKNVVVHRKGATPAGKGVIGLIPGSMTTPTYVVEGKGNEASMRSSSHGAGRAMSRSKAKETYTKSDMGGNLKDANVTLVGGGVDECSMAYKNIDAVMAAQADLIDVRGKFMPVVVCMAEEQAKPWEKE
jgi:tRNA-splicing ligase RtcB